MARILGIFLTVHSVPELTIGATVYRLSEITRIGYFLGLRYYVLYLSFLFYHINQFYSSHQILYFACCP
jgi:hypothetical protein